MLEWEFQNLSPSRKEVYRHLAPGLKTGFLNAKFRLSTLVILKKPGFSGLVENGARYDFTTEVLSKLLEDV